MSNQQAVKGKLMLPSNLHEVSRAEKAVLVVAQEHGFDEHDRFAIKLALEEAMSNAIKHGNRFDPNKRVSLEYCVNCESVMIRVSDEGNGFDPKCVADPTLDENLEKPSGRGVMLMRVYMNEVEYNDAGNCVTLIKQRSETQSTTS